MAEVDVSPADLKFRFQLGKQLLATININNPLDKRVAFKIKTTAPKKYVVRPSSGVVEPKSSVSIQVIMQAQKDYPADFQNCKDKFMVQTTSMLDGDDQIDKDTFVKETRKDLRESRLRVIMEGPAAPPSPVPEANEADEEGARATAETFRESAPPVAAAGAAGSDVRLKTTLSDLSAVSTENAALKSSMDRLARERDELRKKLDYIELQGPSKASSAVATAPSDSALKFRVTMLHMILVAILAFLIGHYT